MNSPSMERTEAGRLRLAMTALVAIFQRDLRVTWRELIQFLLQAMIQPLFFLFIFGKVLPGIGLAAGGFAALLLPGIVSLSGMLAAIQGVTLPLVLDLGFARKSTTVSSRLCRSGWSRRKKFYSARFEAHSQPPAFSRWRC